MHITLALKRLRQEDHKFQTKVHGETVSNKTKQQPPKKAKENNTDTDFKISFVFTVEEKVKGNDNSTLCMCIINKGFIPITMKTQTRDDTPPPVAVDGTTVLFCGRTASPPLRAQDS